jgi:hypothetical protein
MYSASQLGTSHLIPVRISNRPPPPGGRFGAQSVGINTTCAADHASDQGYLATLELQLVPQEPVLQRAG